MLISGTRERTVLLAGTVAVVVTALAVVAVILVRGPAPSTRTTPAAARSVAAPAARSASPAGAADALVVLHDWDRARAAAWSAGDVGALRRLYLRGSAAGERDVAMLRSWLARGLRVSGMSMQVVAIEVRARTAQRMVLVVTDRLVGASATRGPRRGRRLPGDTESTRLLVLARQHARWVVASVQDVGRAAASPAASTASTSSSANR